MGANLTYYVFEGVLVGQAGGRQFHIFARSGGGGGTTKGGETFVGNNPYMTGFRTAGKGKSHLHGGPVPLGRYKIEKPTTHPHLGLSALLKPDPPRKMAGRSGFFIHGRGPHGSDGCIVPLGSFEDLIKAIEKDGGGVLHVVESFGDSRFA